MRRIALATLLTAVVFSGVLQAQRSSGRWTFGIHGGADVSDHETLKLLGGQFAFSLPRGFRIQVAASTVIEEAGTQVFGGASLQWTPGRGALQPYLGGGLALLYAEVGPFSDTDFGLLAQAGIRVRFRNVTPFAEVRLMRFTATATQILAGFEVRVY